jgi:hypothetical protein
VEALTDCFEAWRVLRAGRREVVEGVVAPGHRGPSAELARALAAWPHTYYWADPAHEELILVRPLDRPRREPWLLHGTLFLLTALCALGAGAALQGTYTPTSDPGFLGLLRGSLRFFPEFLQQPLGVLWSGWRFAVPLLTILLVHELGHFFAARRYSIDVSPPFFLPIPATVSPIGSLGAFLRLRSPVVDRRQLLDVGAAGPLAGFAVVLLVLAWGYASSPLGGAPAPGIHSFITLGGADFPLGDSLLTRWFRRALVPGAGAVHLSQEAFAGWAGALITGLNLLPLSQLDGGHVAYGLLGRRQTPAGLAALLGLLLLAEWWSGWLFWVLVTLTAGGWRWTHPSVLCPHRPVPRGRRVVGWLCMLVFIVTFVPVPFGP